MCNMHYGAESPLFGALKNYVVVDL
jgi:hypothetical protein